MGGGVASGAAVTTAASVDALPVVLAEHRPLFGLLDVCHAVGKPALLCGPDTCGKACAARAWAATRGLEVVEVTPPLLLTGP